MKVVLKSTIDVTYLDHMGDDELAGQACASLAPKTCSIRAKILHSKLVSGGCDREGKLSAKYIRFVLAVDIDVVFAHAGIDAVDDMVVVLVNQHRGSTEDDKVEIEDG